MTRRLYREELDARLDEALFASPSHRSTSGLAEHLEPLAREQQEAVLRWAAVAAHSCGEIGYLIASLAPQAFARLDAAGFDAWVLAGLDAYDRHGGRAAMVRLRDLDGFCAGLGEARAGASLAELQARLAGFVRGLSGRALGVREGAAAWTDTETIYLPGELAALTGADANRRLYKAIAALLWAQTRYGTFGSAALDLASALARRPDRDRALRWFAVLEAVRLEARIGEELPGLAAEIARLRGPWPDALREFVPRLQSRSAGVADTLELLDRCMERGEPPCLPHAGIIDPDAALAVRAGRIGRETAVLRKALAVLRGSAQPGESAVARLTAEGDAALLDGEAAALPPEARAAASSLVQDLGVLPPECLVPAGPGPWRPVEREGGAQNVDCDPHRGAGRLYDEWDYRRRAHRRGWCHLFEVELAPGERTYVEEVRARYAPAIRQIRRRFEALRGEDRMLGRQSEGEDIDVDAVVEAMCDRAGGVEPSSRLLRRRVRNERSLAAMFMVDMSGSTKGWVNDAEREALVMLCEALEALGDAYAIYGFSGWTRTRCDIYPVKRFDERYGEAVRSRIAAIEAKDYTRMGVAIRHLTRLTEAQPARHRLLVTLSDGRPDDFDDDYRGHYGIEDTRHALQEAHARGVRSYCITIDRHGADYLSRLYGPARYTVLDDVTKLPLKVADIYRRLAS